MKSWSLRSRLFLLIVPPLVLIAGLAGIARLILAERISEKLYDDTLLTVALTISRDVILSEGDMLAEQLLDRLTNALGDPVYYRIVGPDGRFVTGYTDAPARPDKLREERGVPAFFDAEVLGKRVRAVVLEEFISEPQFGGWVTVEVWQTVQQREQLSLLLLYQSMAIMGVVILAAALLVWFGIRLGLKPVTDLKEAVELRSPDDLRPIRRPLPVEIRTLVGAMNALFGRLERAFAQRDAFIADAAHQLRNPVAAMQAQIESLTTARSDEDRQQRISGLIETARLTGRLTQQLLLLEKARNGVAGDRKSSVDLAVVARDITSRAAERTVGQPVELDFSVTGTPANVSGDAVLLGEAVQNLLDNAIRYGAGADGKVSVSVSITFKEFEAEVAVTDLGPGIPLGLHGRIFDRFFRGNEQDQSGSGLGLSIARSIAEAHGGTAGLEPVEIGTRAVIRLPLEKPRP